MVQRIYCLSIALLLSLSGCAQNIGDDITAARASIIDGKAATEQDAVVYLILGNSHCTGVLIAPKLVLTAKHCVLNIESSDISVWTGESFEGYYFDKYNKTWRDPQTREAATSMGEHYANVTEVRTTAGSEIVHYENGQWIGLDIALLLLNQEGSLTPANWVDSDAPGLDSTVTAVGYGQRNVGATGAAGTKMQADAKVIEVTGTEFIIEGPTTCFGDSGGPGFAEDGRVWGVVSRGEENCAGVSVFTRTDAYAEQIQEAINDSEGVTTVSSPEATPDSSGGVQTPPSVDQSNKTIPAADGLAPQLGRAGCSTTGQPNTNWFGLAILVFAIIIRSELRYKKA